MNQEIAAFTELATSYPAGALGPGEGRRMPNSDHFIYKVTPEEAQGRFALLEGGLAPRMLIPPHVHTGEDEISFVMSGTLGAWVGGVERAIEAGGVLLKPRNVPHAMWNPTDRPTVLMEFITPGAYVRFFEEVGALAGGWSAPAADLDALAARYGQTWIRDADWLPDVVARHGLNWRSAAAGR